MSNFEQFAVGAVRELAYFEAVNQTAKPAENKDPAEEPPAAVDLEQAMFEAIQSTAVTGTRALAMSAVIAWAESGDPTADDFDATAQEVADIDEDGEVSDEETEVYNDVLFAMAQALLHINVDASVVQELLDGSDAAASTAYVAVSEMLENKGDKSTAEIVAEFSVTEQVMTEAKVKVVRDGQFVWKKKPLKKRRRSAAQRAALKRARMKANTAAARAKRKKSNRKRAAAGM